MREKRGAKLTRGRKLSRGTTQAGRLPLGFRRGRLRGDSRAPWRAPTSEKIAATGSTEGRHGVHPTGARAVRREEQGALRAAAEGVRRDPERVRRAGPRGRARALRGARGGDDSRLRGSGRDPPHSRRASGRPRLVRVGQGPADGDRLQPPRRRAGLEGDRALEDRSLHLHAAGGHLLRPGHHRRQGTGAVGAVRGARRARRRGAGEHQGALGARGGGRLAPLRRHAARHRSRGEDRRRGRLRHRVGVAGAARAIDRVCAGCSR